MSKDRTHSEFDSLGAIIARDKRLPQVIAPKTGPDREKETALENQQLDLFQFFLGNTDEQRNQLSNAIDLWDSVPRYSVSRQEMTKSRIDGRWLERRSATFQHRGKSYKCVVTPARVADLDKVEREFYPSAAEELVEDALRKLATEERAGFFDKANFRSGVVFTLYELREEMEKRGHTRSFQEITQSLKILNRCSIEIAVGDDVPGEGFASSPCLPSLAAVSRKRLQEDPHAKWTAQFHPLVTAAIAQVTHRQYNYHRMMSHSSQLARWLHKQLVSKYVFADQYKLFEMRYSTIKRDSHLLNAYGRERDAIDAVESAFKELMDPGKGILGSYKREDERGPRKKLLDVVFTLTPTIEYIRETKAANKRQQMTAERVAKSVGIGRGTASNSVGIGRGSR